MLHRLAHVSPGVDAQGGIGVDFGRSPVRQLRLLVSQLNDKLAEVLALEQTDEGLGCVLQAEDDVFADIDLFLLHRRRAGMQIVTDEAH